MDTAKGVAKNLKFILASELILAGLKFVSRRVFVIALGKEYLGLNGLFTDILSMLSLAELGFGVSVTYSLYRPAAQGDTQLIKSLVRLYRRVYQAVGGAVGHNPISIIVPCHRVIGANGSLTGYAGGLETKRMLLACEGVGTDSAPVCLHGKRRPADLAHEPR